MAMNDLTDVERMRRVLPVSAYPRPQLQAFLLTRGAVRGAAPKLSILDVFRGDDQSGPLCRFTISGDKVAETFVAPLSQVSIDRRFLFARRHAGRTCAKSSRGPV
jgi:hypothetical protein